MLKFHLLNYICYRYRQIYYKYYIIEILYTTYVDTILYKYIIDIILVFFTTMNDQSDTTNLINAH